MFLGVDARSSVASRLDSLEETALFSPASARAWSSEVRSSTNARSWISGSEAFAMKNRPFTLEPNRWYAMQFHGKEFSPGDSLAYSPIHVFDVKPLKMGNDLIELEFHHENYPQGVQDKGYRLQVLARDATFLFARRVEKAPVRYLMLFELTWPWLRTHFGIEPRGEQDVQRWREDR